MSILIYLNKDEILENLKNKIMPKKNSKKNHSFIQIVADINQKFINDLYRIFFCKHYKNPNKPFQKNQHNI